MVVYHQHGGAPSPSSSPTRRGASSRRKLRPAASSSRSSMAAHTPSGSKGDDVEKGNWHSRSGTQTTAITAISAVSAPADGDSIDIVGTTTPGPSAAHQQQLVPPYDSSSVSAANDRFLDEVEGELLSDSSGQTLLNGNSNKGRHQPQHAAIPPSSLLSPSKADSSADKEANTYSTNVFEPHSYNPHQNLQRGRGHAHTDSALSMESGGGGGHGSSNMSSTGDFRRKVRTGIFYVFAGTVYELVIYKLAQRTVWPNATLFVPLELVALATAVTILSFILRRRGGNAQLQNVFGMQHAGNAKVISAGWREVLPLAAAVGAAATLRILKDAFLEPSISTSVSTFIAPTLLLILPSILSATEASPRNGFLILAALAIPVLYGVSMADMQVVSGGVVAALGFVLVESTKLGLAKKWFISRSSSPLETLVQYLPPAALWALLVVLPLSIFNGAPLHLPHLWGWYFLAHLVGSLLNQLATLMAINAFSSPLSVALLNVPKGLLITSFNGGVVQGHAGASHEYMISCGISMIIVVLAVPELRRFILEDSKTLAGGSAAGHGFELAPHSPASPPSHRQLQIPSSVAALSPRATRFLALTSFVPLIYWIISQGTNSPFDYDKHLTNLKYYTHSRTVDIVISYYDEEPHNVAKLVNNLRYYPWIKNRDPRFIVYMKNGNLNNTIPVDEFIRLTAVDEVHDLRNRGREAGTYLQHILRNYNDSISPSLRQKYRPPGLADHTLFMQPHLAWDWIARERLWLFRDDTGYLHFAPYIKLDCGRDMNGNGDFPRLREIYNIFRGELCPPTHQLGAYSSQFVVSKRRILANSYQKYKSLDDILEADADHWIHQEGTWWKYHGEPGPTNPFLGHAMERAWPTIFDCANPILADTCAGDNYTVTGCQCFDT